MWWFMANTERIIFRSCCRVKIGVQEGGRESVSSRLLSGLLIFKLTSGYGTVDASVHRQQHTLRGRQRRRRQKRQQSTAYLSNPPRSYASTPCGISIVGLRFRPLVDVSQYRTRTRAYAREPRRPWLYLPPAVVTQKHLAGVLCTFHFNPFVT